MTMTKAAADYCDLMTGTPQWTASTLALRLASLGAAVLRLERDDLSLPSEVPEVRELTSTSRLDIRDQYWGLLDATDPASVREFYLSDDLLDIYFDVATGLEVARSDPHRIRSANSFWRFSFDSHWGHHLWNALHFLHQVAP